ncbi:MAG: IgGFc-binding protein [Labilithrix sp.]|nr:IgGFc-binding protein [Labilithrix sp.]
MNAPRPIRTFVACGVTLLAALLGNACSRDRGFDEPLRTDFDTDAEAPSPPEECTTVKCSLDLKRVVSGCDDSIVIKECDKGLGCAEGACIEDACRSAELAKGSIGCSFYTLPPIERVNGSDQCFVAMVANTWDLPVSVTAEYGSQTIDISKSIYTAENDGAGTIHEPLQGPIPPGKVALVFLSQGPNASSGGLCPPEVVPALDADPILRESGVTHAFRLSTNLPVSAYSVYPYGGAKAYIPTATLLLPTSAWSTNYLAIDAWPGTARQQKPFLQIVAREDDTEVRMRPNANIEDSEGFTGGGAGQTQVWKLARGEVLQITQGNSLAGSPIESTKPVGLFGGTQCNNIPSGVCCCDTLQQQIPPLSQWGSEYALVPYLSRLDTGTGGQASSARETVPYRIVGAVDGTKLTYDPETPTGAPETLSAGQVVTFSTNRYVTVKSQDNNHPFYAAVYMTGSWSYGTQIFGDPDFVNIVPSDQFLDRYVFSTDYTYPETSITLVRKRTASGFKPVALDCVGEVTGWQALDSKGEYEYLFMRLTRGFLPQKFGSSSCGYGRREAKSEGPFSVTVWGLGRDASYGYPGGMGLRPVNTVTVAVPR